MKKIIFVITAILFLISCDPAKYMRVHTGSWYIKNNLDYPITISICNDDAKRVILPKDSIEFLSYNIPIVMGEPPFDRLFSGITWDEHEEQDRRVDIMSKEGKVLKAWYITGKDEPGKHFFKEEYWKLYKKHRPDKSTRYKWVFEVTSEDIPQISEE